MKISVSEIKNDFKRFFLWALIVSLSLSALIGIIIFLFGKFGETEEKIITTTISIGVSSVTGLCCSTIFFKDKLKSLSITGMLASFAFLVIIVVTIWGNFKNHELEKYLGTSVILTITFSQSSLLLLAKNTNKLVRNVLIATLIFISVVAIMLLITLWNGKINNEFFYRLLGVFAILDVLGTIVTLILSKTGKPPTSTRLQQQHEL